MDTTTKPGTERAPPAPELSRQLDAAAVREANAKAASIETDRLTGILDSWPEDSLADRLVAIGLGVIGSGGLEYFLAGYPSEGFEVLPALLLWTLGVPLLVWGLIRLRDHVRTRTAWFRETFKVPSSTPTLAWMVRLPGILRIVVPLVLGFGFGVVVTWWIAR